MTRRPDFSEQRGVTLIELVVVMAISLVVLSGTLLTFNSFQTNQRANDRFTEQVEISRSGLEVLARQLRNLARPGITPSGFATTPSINLAAPYDFIFQTSDPQRTWVRYCLQTSGAGPTGPVTANRAVLWESISPTATLSSSMTASCPGTGWSERRLVTDYVTNRAAGKDRPVFQYTCSVGTTCTTTNLLEVKGVRSDLYVDVEPAVPPAEQVVSTGVFLRNQNEPPTAAATSRPAGPGTVALNGSGSDDPEGRTLTYFWFVGSVPTGWSCGKTVPATANHLTGVTATLTGARGSTATVTLVVCDPGDLGAQSPALTVRFP